MAMTYDCMTPEEYALWRLDRTAKIPCRDCPMWFAEQALAAGRCNGSPPKPALRPLGRRGPRPVYATPEERLAARRATWRESKQRARVASMLEAGAQC